VHAYMQMVAEFHEHQKIAARLFSEIQSRPDIGMVLNVFADVIRGISENMEQYMEMVSHSEDPRLLRAHLITEELSEFISAMAVLDEELTLDALADLKYVVVGSAVVFELPLPEAFVEVHRSNMTKKVRIETDVRVRDKGSKWDPPRLKQILKRHRNKK